MKTVVQNKILEQEYPIAGRYLTTFEDEEDGKTVQVRAPAVLHQKGREVRGETSLPGDERLWRLEGEISDQGYLNGIYFAEDPHDDSAGNFFLHIHRDRRLEGIWSGYDEVNDKINSGRYKFIPWVDGVTIRDLEERWIPEVLRISEQQLGRDYVTPDLLHTSINDEPYFTMVAVRETGQPVPLPSTLKRRLLGRTSAELYPDRLRAEIEVLGFTIGGVVTLGQLDDYLHVSLKDLPESLTSVEPVGLMRTTAVSEGYQGRGIGFHLVQEKVQRCLDGGANVLCAVAWHDGDDANAGGILERLGFEPVMTVDEYWREASIEEDYACPSCGEPPCTCAAKIYSRPASP